MTELEREALVHILQGLANIMDNMNPTVWHSQRIKLIEDFNDQKRRELLDKEVEE